MSERPQTDFKESARNRYAGAWGENYQRHKRAIPDAAYAWVSRLRARKFAAWITENQVVFEYGAGHGWNLAGLRCQRRLGYDVAAFLAPELEAHGIEFVAETGRLPDAVADAVICHHTLEHLWQPPEALREMARLLRPAGVLLLQVPFERERRYRHYDPAEPNQHLYSWNVQTLANLVTAAGFTVVEAGVGRFGYDRFAAQWAVRLRLGEIGFRVLRGMLHALKPAYEVRLAARRPTAIS